MTEADEVIPDHPFREISDVALWAIEDRSERAQARRRPTITDGGSYLASPEEMTTAVADSAADVPRLIAEVRHLTVLVESVAQARDAGRPVDDLPHCGADLGRYEP